MIEKMYFTMTAWDKYIIENNYHKVYLTFDNIKQPYEEDDKNRIRWCNENLKDHAIYAGRFLYAFKNKDDAVFFKLTWG